MYIFIHGCMEFNISPQKIIGNICTLETSGLMQKLPINIPSSAKGILGPYPGWLKEQYLQIMNLRASFAQHERLMYYAT